MSRANEPAFPRLEHVKHGNFSEARYVWETHGGLTKREYFAAMAMQGLLALEGYSFQGAAKDAVTAADALIAELEKEPTK